jgi:hypothetical protein
VLSGARVDELSMLAVLAAGLVALGLLVRHRPDRALLLFVLTVCFVPYWIGRSVGPFVPAVVGLAAVLIVALVERHEVRLHVADILLGVVVATALVSFLAGFVTLSSAYGAVVEWTVPYLLGRMVASQVPRSRIALAVAIPFVVVAGMAVVESITGTNPFHAIGASSPLHGVWGNEQVRGGVVRSEGAFGHSIALGACLAMVIPMVWAARLPAPVKLLALAVIAGGTVATLSRIGIVTAVLALVLSLLVLRDVVSTRFRVCVVAVLAAGAAIAAPYLTSVFTEAGDEASGSAAYRGDLLSLVPEMSLLGRSGASFRAADGAGGFGDFGSIDNALVLIGLQLGVLPIALLLVLGVLAVVRVMRPAPPAALVGVVASMPALTSVAFITQYTVFFWFMVGLAATASREVEPPAEPDPPVESRPRSDVRHHDATRALQHARP